MKKSIALSVKSIGKLKTLKYHTFLIKHQFFPLFVKCGSKDEKKFKEEELIETLKVLDFIKNMEEYQMNI